MTWWMDGRVDGCRGPKRRHHCVWRWPVPWILLRPDLSPSLASRFNSNWLFPRSSVLLSRRSNQVWHLWIISSDAGCEQRLGSSHSYIFTFFSIWMHNSRLSQNNVILLKSEVVWINLELIHWPRQPVTYLYMETFSMRSLVSVSVMMMPFGEIVKVTFRNFLALALAWKHTGGLKK